MMALLNQSVQVYGKLGQLFEKLLAGQAPNKFTREFLKDLGFKSSNWHTAIALLKGLGFLSEDGSPTPRYMEFLAKTKWKKVLALAVKDAYSDVFVMKRDPAQSDVQLIADKYKSIYNMSDTAADRAARTFMALLKLSDRDVILGEEFSTNDEHLKLPDDKPNIQGKSDTETPPFEKKVAAQAVGLNYNIQIYLSATKDFLITHLPHP